MNQIKITGGARVGLSSAAWPFASLIVTRNRLDLYASVLGSFAFAPGDIISLEAVPGFWGSSIRIHHKVENYKKRIEFQTNKDPNLIINQIIQTGFLDNHSVSAQKDILDKQKQGGFPLKLTAIIVIMVVWNLLIINDFIHFFNSTNKIIPFGKGFTIGTSFIFLTAFLTNFFPDFRKFILKDGRDIEEIRSFLYFMMLISSMMFITIHLISRLVI